MDSEEINLEAPASLDIETKTEVVEEVKKDEKIVPFDLPDSNRDEIYKALSKPEKAADDPSVKKDSDESLKTGAESPDNDSDSVESSSDKDDSKDEQGEKSDSQTRKTVPLAALHAEREKRKEANLAAKKQKEEFEAKIRDLTGRLDSIEGRKMDEQFEKLTEDDEDLSDRERLLIKKLKMLESNQKRVETQSLKTIQQAQYEQIQRRTNEVDQALEQEGYPGFILAGPQIQTIVQKRLSEGLINEQDLQKEDTYIEAFKEEVFPQIARKFKLKESENVLRRKIEDKKAAQLIDSSGKAPVQEEKKSVKPKSFEEAFSSYIEQRKKQVIE